MSDESIAEALETVRTGAGDFAGGVVTQKRVGSGAVDVLHDGSVEANDDTEGDHTERYDAAEAVRRFVMLTGCTVEHAQDQADMLARQFSLPGELFEDVEVIEGGPGGTASMLYDASGYRVRGSTPADPFWGEVLDDEAAKVEQPLSETERDELVATASQHSRQAAAAERRAEAYRFEAKAANKAAKEADSVAAEHRAESDSALLAADTAMQARETMCPVRLRVIDDERVVVVLHPETGEVVEQRDLTDDDRQLKLTANDEADGIDRMQIRARLQAHQDALSISRGVHAVPPQSEIDAWPTGVCKATAEWLDSIDRIDDETQHGDLKPLPVWVAGVRGSDQDVSAAVNAGGQVSVEYGALLDGTIFGDPVGGVLTAPAKGTVRLGLPDMVATMKRQQVSGGTSQHLTVALRVAGDFGGVPQLKAAVADADGALLRQLHYIAKCKPAPDGAADEDVRATVIAAIERTLEVAS